MATQKQIDANRRNAQKCTGPKTPEGKARSSRNALKTGLYSQYEVMTYEHKADFEELTDSYYRRFAPSTHEERALLDMLITAEWLARRYRAADALVINRAIENCEKRSFGLTVPRVAGALTLCDRRINSAQRNYEKALKQLMALRVLQGLPALPLPAADENRSASEPTPTNEIARPNLVSFPHIPELPEPSTPSASAPVVAITHRTKGHLSN